MSTGTRLVPMLPRDPRESGRAASALELFFDLVFVIAISMAGSNPHHPLAEGRAGYGVQSYVIVVFGI